MKYWETIADNLSRVGWSLGWVSAIDSNGGTIWIADPHPDDGKRFVVHADEILTAFSSARRGHSRIRVPPYQRFFNQAADSSLARVLRLFRIPRLPRINSAGKKEGRADESY